MKLIGLDRSIEDEVVSLGYEGEMYNSLTEWTASKCDWNQLGLLAAEIILGTHDHQRIIQSSLVDADDCLRKLIKEGKYLGSEM